MLDARALVNEAANRAWAPPPITSLADWSDANRFLGADSSEQGNYRTARTPYARQIMDVLSPSHPARHIAFAKGSQIGATTIGLNWTGFIVACCPAPMIITLPSEGVAKEWSNQRLTQLVDSTPALEGKILEARLRGSGNTIYMKRIAGTSATIKIAWSSSAKKLASTPAAYLLSDEVDRFDGDTDGEGNPLGLLDRRFATFPRGKHYKASTPTGQPSRIWAEFLKGDQRYYFVPCPFCGHFQRLDFHRLKWMKGQPETAAYLCLKCEQRIPERFKSQFLARGIWLSTDVQPGLLNTGFADHREFASILAAMEETEFVSFHLSAMYSPIGWYAWRQLAADWEEAQKETANLKVFVNTVLGEVWKEKGQARDADVLYGKREFYERGIVPPGGLFLTLTTDVQADRLEWELKAWGRNRECWSVDAGVISGDTMQRPCWDALHELIVREWPHASGATMPLWAAGIDTGYRPQKVYDFCSRYAQPAYGPAGAVITALRTVVPIKGGHDWQKFIEGFSATDAAKKRDGLRIITVGSAALKQAVYDSLGIAAPAQREGDTEPLVYPAGYWHYPNYERFWFSGLCAESLVTTSSGKREWVKDKDLRNEPLDLAAYNLALYELCGAARFAESDWAELERRVMPPVKVELPKQTAQAKPQQDWLGGRGNDWF